MVIGHPLVGSVTLQTTFASPPQIGSAAAAHRRLRPHPIHPYVRRHSTMTTGEQTAECSRQLGVTEGGSAYAAVVARRAVPRLTSGPPKPIAKGPDSSEPAVSMEAAQGRKSPDLSGPLGGMPAGAPPPHAHVVPAGERRNKTPIFVSGVSDTRGFLKWLRESCPSGLTAQVKGDKLMHVPKTADGFRATVTALRSLDGSKGVSFTPYRCLRTAVCDC